MEAFFRWTAIHTDTNYLQEYIAGVHEERRRALNKLRRTQSPSLEGVRAQITDEVRAEIQNYIDEEKARHITAAEIAERIGLHDVYLTEYTALSGAVHTSALDLDAHFVLDEDTQEVESLRFGPKRESMATAICHAGMALAHARHQIARTFGEDYDRQSKAHIRAFQIYLHS